MRLAGECAADRGIVLANSNDGSPILFHSDCSVITNNTIASDADEAHLLRAARLFRMQPQEIRRTAPEVRYLIARTSDFSPEVDGAPRLLTDNPIVAQLLLADQPPEGFTVLHTVYFDSSGGPAEIYARLYKITPPTPIRQ